MSLVTSLGYPTTHAFTFIEIPASPTAAKKTNMDQWLECENFQNGIRARASNSLATFSEFPPEYRPGAKPFEVPVYAISNKACQIFCSLNPHPALKQAYLLSDKVRFPVHPVNLENDKIPHIAKVCSHLFTSHLVSPTSSTRTVYSLDKTLPAHCIKPHTDLKITRWRRHMEARKIEHAVAVTKIFEEATLFDQNKKLAYYPESIGIVYGGEKESDWGFIVREMQSKPYLNRPYRMVPLCSLYISNSRDKASRPVALELIEKSKKEPSQFILEDLLFPLIAGWAEIYLKTGVLLEAHGQNVIVEIDSETNEIIRFAHRDFDCEVNSDLVKQNGFSLDHLNKKDLFTLEGESGSPQGSMLSLMFDNSMRVPFEALADLAHEHFAIDKEALKAACRNYLQTQFPDLCQKHFPRNGKAYHYEVQGENNVVVERNQAPDWR